MKDLHTHVSTPLDLKALREKAEKMTPEELNKIQQMIDLPTEKETWENFQRRTKMLEQEELKQKKACSKRYMKKHHKKITKNKYR